MKYIVYITVNNVNDKVYIGVHKTEDPEIFDGYIGCGVKISMPSTYMKPSTAFQAAVKKYGTKAFSRKTLYIYDTAEEAYQKEAELVTAEFIESDTNYNMICGGGFLRTTDPIYQFDLTGKLLKKWESIDSALEFFNCSKAAFKTSLHFKESLLGFYWSRASNIDIKNFSKGTPKKQVYRYTKSGKLVQSYKSILEAAKDLNTPASNLIAAIQGSSLVNKMYYVSYQLYETFTPKPRTVLKNKTFYVYNNDTGEFLNEYSLDDLRTFMGVKSNASIHDAIKRRGGLYKDYQISLEKYESVKPIKKLNKAKAVDVFDKLGNLLKTCSSVGEASKLFGSKLSDINRVLRGLACTSKGYIYKWHKS